MLQTFDSWEQYQYYLQESHRREQEREATMKLPPHETRETWQLTLWNDCTPELVQELFVPAA